MSKTPLTIEEAWRLHNEAPSLTVAELRRLGEVHLRTQWLTSVRKKTLVASFRRRLEEEIARLGTKAG